MLKKITAVFTAFLLSAGITSSLAGADYDFSYYYKGDVDNEGNVSLADLVAL